MSGSNHIKRVAAPRAWPIERKTSRWVAKPTPGAHSQERGMPLVVVLRDILELADKSKEIKQIMHEGKILVDGKVRKDHRFIVGMFDLITVPAMGLSYMVVVDESARFKLAKVGNSTSKLCKIVNKTTLRGGKTQLNLHDGTTMLASNDYKTKDTIIIKVPERTIDQHIPYEVGSMAMVIEGKHAGTIGTIKEIRVLKSSSPNVVKLSSPKGDFETIETYVFVVGKEAPAIDLGVKA